MPSSGLPSLPVMPSSLRESLVTLLGPAPNANAVLVLARLGARPEIEAHRLRLIAYRDKVAALINIIESGLNTPETKPIASTRQAILAPTAAA